MFRLILISSLLFHSFFGMSHDFFFSFAEVELDELNGRIEVTIVATTHDIEKELRIENSPFTLISGNENDSTFLKLMEEKINRDFQIQINGTHEKLRLDGVEIMLNGVTNLFLSGNMVESVNKLDLYFAFLMKTFPDQQNKATILFRGQKKTAVFLPNMPKQTIKLTNENE